MKFKYLAYSLVTVILFATSCDNKKSKQANENALRQVPVAPIAEIDTTIYVEYVADIQARKNVEVRSRLSGFLEKIYVEEGAMVKEGQLLFKINDEEYHADLNRAEAILSNALADTKTVEVEMDRIKMLVKNNIVSKTELDVITAKLVAAESRVAEAKSTLRNAKARLNYTLIKAPFSGTVDRLPLKAGSLIQEGSLLTSISDLSAVNVYFSISEKEYLDIANSDSYKNNFSKNVKLSLADGSIYPLEGVARFAESEFAANTGSLSLKATFPNQNGLLKHNATGKVKVPVETGKIKIVNQKSVFDIQDKTYVYILDDKNTLKMKSFDAGQRIGHYYIVNDGLNTGDKVIFEGVQNLKDGMVVDPKIVDPNSDKLSLNK